MTTKTKTPFSVTLLFVLIIAYPAWAWGLYLGFPLSLTIAGALMTLCLHITAGMAVWENRKPKLQKRTLTNGGRCLRDNEIPLQTWSGPKGELIPFKADNDDE